MYSSAPGSELRQLEYLEGWLVTIAQNTKDARMLLERRDKREEKDKTEPSWVDKLGKRLEGALGHALGSGLGQARSLAARGFSGTVEQARMDYSLDMLGKQFAAVMMPVMQGMTYFTGELEKRMRAMGGSEQNRMMGAILGGGAGMWAGRMLGMGGVPGALLGMGLMPGLMGGGSTTTDNMMATAGAAWGAFRLTGNPYVAAAAGGAAAVSTTPDSYENESGAGYYTRLRHGGASRLGAGFSTAFESLSRMFGGSTRAGGPPETFEAIAAVARARPPAADPRRDVTPYKFDVGEAGSSYWRTSEGVMKATNSGENDAGPLKPFFDLLLNIYDVLSSILVQSGGAVPPPRPASS